MFPNAGSQIYRNEDGEVLGWDQLPYPDTDERDYEEEAYWADYSEDGGPGEWVICDECGDEYEDGDPGIEDHEKETGHKRWS